ncbi:MAG: hypothetical protein KC646_02850 [Candidatus Cloacimonetes bacterium]|nr:hypothetical protein [Candidatus Cloacimonadota bacterium]
MLSSVLAISIKHLGLLYFICLGFSFATWSIIRKHLNYQLIAAYLCSLVIGLSFYPINNSLIYLKNAIAHNNSINTNQFLFITAIIVIFFTCVFYVTNYKTSDKVVLPKLFSYFILPILLSTIICFFVVQPRYSPSNLCIAIILINSLIISAFSYFFTLSKLRGFTYIFIAISLVVASLLYFSHIGKSFYIFAIPLILCFHQSFCESKNIKAFIFIILGEIIFSNFFPSLQYLNKKSSYLGDQVYTSLFNTTYINYLSWQSCKIPKIRKEIEHTISAYDFPIHQNKIIFINLHQHTQVSLYLPYNLQAPHPTFAKLEDSLASDLSALKNQTIDNPIQIFSQMQTSHEFPLIIEALKPFTQSDHRVSDSLVEVLINNEKSLNEFAQVFALEYFQRIKTSHQLNKLYHQYKVPKIDPSFNIYIKKSIPLKNENKVVNFELNELIDTYQGSKK